MKTKKLLPIFFFICTQLAFGQITFQKSFYDITDSLGSALAPAANANDIKETYDGGYIITGFIGNAIALIKLDRNGDTVWTKYWADNLPVGYSVLQTCDSGYISSGTGMIKTDSNGNILWSKNYPAASVYHGDQSKIIKTNDCGYILASTTDSFGAGGNDMYIIKTDTGGNPVWSRTYGGAGDDEATAIKQTADGGYIVAGFTNSFDTSGYDAYLIKTDANGDTLWTKTYGPPISQNIGYTIQQTYDHGYVLLGFGDLIKTDSMGNVIWSKTYDGGGGNSIQQTSDSGYIFLYLNLLIRTNSSGNILWALYFPGPDAGQGSVSANTVLQTNDGGYILTDYTQITTHFEEQTYINLNKTDVNGQSGCNETNATVSVSTVSITASGTPTEVTSPVTTVITSSVTLGTESMSISTACATGISESRLSNSPIVYPNPVSPDGCISIYLNENLNGVELTIFNIMGEVLYSQVANGTGQTILLSLKGKLSKGMYFLRVKQGENICVQKIVVMG